MLTTNSNYELKNAALAKNPVYVAEIFFNNGNSGTDGTNDIYFATCDVNEITGFAHTDRWFPFLKSDSISSMSQTVDPINGVSSVGNLSLSITDYNGMVSDIIKAADTAGHGLRRQRLSIIMLYKGMDWADRVVVRTMQINDLRLSALNEYKLTATDVQRQLQKTVFNPYSTTLSAAIASTGAITPSVVDARKFIATTQQTYGTAGFIKIEDEIMMWTAKTDNGFTISAGGRGMFGSTAAVHAIGKKVSEIIVLQENPITMALKVMQSTGEGSNGTWDVYPARWGCGMDNDNDVDVNEWLEVGKLLVGLADTPAASDGVQFEFVLDEGIEAKKFIEDQILKILGAFGFVHGDGRYGIRAYSDLSNAIKENASITADRNNVVKWGDLTYNYNDLTNQVWIEYDEAAKLSGKFIRNAIFVDTVSIKKWGEARQLKYAAPGVIPTSSFASNLYQRFQRILARYSRPPIQIELTLLPRFHTVEIGDIVRVSLPVRDLLTGAALDRAFEVISTQLQVKTGEIVIKCIAQPERATFWFGGVGEVYSVAISPAAASVVSGQTQQLTARAFDASGNQLPIPAIVWLATGNVTVDSNGLVMADAVGSSSVIAVVGNKQSNTAAITVMDTANTDPVASVTVSPSTVQFEAGQTQQFAAQAKDAGGAVVHGATFTWASSNSGVASVPAGPSVSAIVTAVADGTANITATETVSAIASAIVPVTVAVPPTPDFTPPIIADSAYQVGTQLTAATHPTVISGATAPYVFVDGGDLPSGDYWVDGDISLGIGHTITINGTVRLFSTGSVTINGTVDGCGRGNQGAQDVYLTGSGPYENGINASPPGFFGNGGDGGNTQSAGYPFVGGRGAIGIHATTPLLSPLPTNIDGNGTWLGITGIPTMLGGSPGATGSGQYNDFVFGGHSGGNAGAGLFLAARSVFISIGRINLDGLPGDGDTVYGLGAAGGGGGGGGSFVGFAEKNINGLPVLVISPNAISTAGGGGGQILNRPLFAGFPGTNGAIIMQVIG